MAKFMIVSDIHGDANVAASIVEQYKKSGAERLILLGDILYHGPRNDLPEGYAPKKVIEILNGVKDEILAVRGNCDTEVDQMVLDFPILAEYAYIFVDGIRIFATHGHNYNTQSLPPMKKGDILLHGHTHIPVVHPFGDGNVYINPGSASIPKMDSPKSYILYENRVFSFRDLNGNEYKSFEF